MKPLPEIVDAIVTAAAGLAPGAFGALVSVIADKGLTWAERFSQLAIGIIVSWFAGGVVNAIWSPDPFVLEGIKFTVGMIAYKATPGFISACADLLKRAPAEVWDATLGRLTRRKDQP